MGRGRGIVVVVCLCALTASACGAGAQRPPTIAPAGSANPTPTPSHPPTPSATLARAVGSATPTSGPRNVAEQDWVTFARARGIALRLPSRRVELVGFHQSNHEGAHELDPVADAVRSVTLETRERLTASRTAADVVSDPNLEIRAPVTGRVKRAGTYVLYCKYSDDYVVIEPDGHPGWEVKALHIDGVRVRPGDRVVAGQTVIAPRPTKLPFESDVDEVTAEPHWPHVHIEVVDTSIPNRPSPNSGC